MPIVTWKIMLRRENQVGYHYLATEQKGWAPGVGEQVKLVVEGRTVKWTIAEIFKDHSTREGIDVFTVRVDETKAEFE
jgi:hypothetical protein